MCAETINETINVCKYVGHKKDAKTVEGDVVLQDIKPDILSIVKIARDISITQVRVEENKIRIDGDIDVSIVYIADDDTNSQRGANSRIDFSEVIDFNGVNENSVIKLKYDIGNAEHKVVNGRKVSIKNSIIFDIKAFNNCDINIVKGIMDDDSMQTQKLVQNICSPIMKNSSDVQLKENVKLDDTNSPISEILNCSFYITNKEYKLSYNKILAKADAKIKIVYITDTERQNVETFETSIPVMGFIDVDGINENSIISMDYLIKNYSIRPCYQDMQANSISLEADIEVISYSCENREVELITDFYTPNAVINIENQNTSVIKNLIDATEPIELSQTLVVPELDNTKILALDGNVNINEKNILNGKIAISGNVDINILYAKNDGRIMENKKLELPFQQVIKINDLTKDMDPIIHIEVESIDYNPNGENQIQVNIKLMANVMSDEEINVNSVTNLEISNSEVPAMPSIIIYYVKPGDTLWSIAKKFRNTIDYIKDINGLNDDIIYPGQRLIISRYQANAIAKSLM